MKIIFQYLYGSGGALANLTRLIEAYIEQYADVDLVVVCSPQSSLRDLDKFPNVTIERYGKENNRAFWRFMLGLKGLSTIAKKHNADIVWSVNTGSFGRMHCPQILQINNSFQVYSIDHARFHPKGRTGVAVLQWLGRLTARVSDQLVCQTNVMADKARSLFQFSKPVHVIGKAVPVSLDHAGDTQNCQDEEGEPKTNTNAYHYGYIATAYTHKNHPVILAAMSEIVKGDTDIFLHLTISEEELEKLGGEQATQLRRSGRIVLHGWVAPEELELFYCRLDGCVMPSIFESLSSAHIEAMAYRKPQVVADLPYARDLCGDSALYVDPHDPMKWAQAMSDLAGDKRLQKQLTERGVEIFRQFPQKWSAVAMQWNEVLESAYSQSTNAGSFHG